MGDGVPSVYSSVTPFARFYRAMRTFTPAPRYPLESWRREVRDEAEGLDCRHPGVRSCPRGLHSVFGESIGGSFLRRRPRWRSEGPVSHFHGRRRGDQLAARLAGVEMPALSAPAASSRRRGLERDPAGRRYLNVTLTTARPRWTSSPDCMRTPRRS